MRYLASVRSERAEEVRHRRDEMLAERQERLVWDAGRRQRQLEAEAAQQEEDRRMKELDER